MSTENKTNRRPYRQNERARKQQQTRQRIIEAVSELHQRVGPAKTTISDVAALAGVGRMTVYKHFPEEFELFAACGAHWSSRHPLPDFDDCLARDSLQERCLCVLQRLYSYYRDNHAMLGKVLGDARQLPDLQKVLEASWFPAMRDLEQALMPPRLSSAQRKSLRASLRLVLALQSWETMKDELSDAHAAQVATTMVTAVLEPR